MSIWTLRKAALLAFVLLAPITIAAKDGDDDDDDERGRNVERNKILDWKTMTGVARPYTGTTNPIRGVNGGGLPWVIESGKGELRADGSLKIEIKGLVFDPRDQAVIDAGLANRNTVAQFRAVVSCMTRDGNNAAVVNIATDPVQATIGHVDDGGGDAKIDTRVNLPKPCIAPIVFVTNANGAWFAATGN